ncbi:MAG: DinB family protein [Acidimicrobiales bacterium]|nr:DinB family protein [Acidimicrobiales bacterium]
MPGNAPALTDEKALLLAYIAQQRDGIRNAAFGLTDEQARQTPTAGTLSIGGLVKHVASTEQHWVDMAVDQDRARARAEQEQNYAEAFRLREDETLAGVLAAYAEVAAETEAAFAAVPLDQPVLVPRDVPWFPADVEAWSVRWVLLHIMEETARHAGHADIVRESIDGATMYELMAGVEGWPETEWLKPWSPPATDGSAAAI